MDCTLFKFTPYKKYFRDLEDSMKELLDLPTKREIYMDIVFPRLPEINTKIRTKNGLKYLYDVSLLMRSLVLQSATKLALSVYSFRPIEKEIAKTDLENSIIDLCQRIRMLNIEKSECIGTDIILLVYYYVHEWANRGKEKDQHADEWEINEQSQEAREFFKGDVRFQAFCSEVLHGIFTKKTAPYSVLEELRQNYGNLNDEETYDEFRLSGYPNFYSISFVQDLDFLSEIGLLYTRSGTVPILTPTTGTRPNLSLAEFQRRYERRISWLGRAYVRAHIEKAYPFSDRIERNVNKILNSGGSLAKLGP
jgi:hypothetical protein